ncbi:MAG: hypothetical protein IT292_08020 [Deltaproteobacteria bacterium]|nr:hypothetical protein [Deltaproteobacteria bacterium]
MNHLLRGWLCYHRHFYVCCRSLVLIMLYLAFLERGNPLHIEVVGNLIFKTFILMGIGVTA